MFCLLITGWNTAAADELVDDAVEFRADGESMAATDMVPLYRSNWVYGVFLTRYIVAGDYCANSAIVRGIAVPGLTRVRCRSELGRGADSMNREW